MQIYLSLLVCLAGGVMFLVVKHPDVKALAKDMFWCGLLIALAQGSLNIGVIGR